MDRLYSELDYRLLWIKPLKKQIYVCEKLFLLPFILDSEEALILKGVRMAKLVTFFGSALHLNVVLKLLYPATLTDIIVTNIDWPIASKKLKTSY